MTIKSIVTYNGANYAGWQRQKNAISVQQVLEEALRKCLKISVVTTAAGRTDAGVHALEMPVSFELPSLNIPLSKLSKAINSFLPFDVRVLSAIEVDPDFNARFDAKSRAYKYILISERDVFRIDTAGYTVYKTDFSLLQHAAQLFIGQHDFTTFSKNNPDTRNTLCNIVESYWEQISESEFVYKVKADRFIYGMVRSLVGSMIDVARGKRNIEDLTQALEAKKRSLNSPLAPPEGLYFVGAKY